MRLEIVRMVADWLIQDINTRIAAVPTDAGDPDVPPIAQFSDPKYPKTTIGVFDETRHPWVMKRDAPTVTPALYVMSNGIFRMKGEPVPSGQIRESEVPVQVAIRYIARQAADLAQAITDGDYTLRAVARSLRELSKNSNDVSTGSNDPARTRNNVTIVLAQGSYDFYPVLESIGQSQVAGALVVNYYIRDYNPSF